MADVGLIDAKTASQIQAGINIVAGAVLCATGLGAGIGASMIGQGVGSVAGGYISEALGGSYETGSLIGGIAGSIIGGQVYKGIHKTQTVSKILDAERVGSGLKGDSYHRAASYLSKDQLAKGTVYSLSKGKTLLQVSGGVNDKAGIFEYILNNKGQIVHQLFKVGGKINGIPN